MTIAHETTFTDVAGKKTQVMRGGSGPHLVYLHSAGGETNWMPFHDALAKNFTVVAPAHPGFDLSEGLDQIHDITDLAWHTVDLLETFKLTNVPVVGFSLGAWLATEVALLRPAYVKKLVLTDAAGLHVEGAPMAELFRDDLEELRNLMFFNVKHPAMDAALPTGPDDPRILLWLRAREATARVGWNPYLHNPKLAGLLRKISCPTRVIWGKQDRLIPLAHGEYYARHIPGAELKIIEDCGHMPPFEKQEEFVRLVTEFVQS